jgi:hypothetical protein
MPASGTESCLNCGAPLRGRYCAACGQARVNTDPTLGEVLHEATHELVHWEGKIPHTLKALFIEPGRLTLDFLAGRRARWLPPVRLYLICSVAFFLSGPLVRGIAHRTPRNVAQFSIRNDNRMGPLTPEERDELAAGLPGRIFGVERLERAAADNEQLSRVIDAIFPKAMFVLLPMFALLTSLVWRRARRRYPAHLYLSLHLHAAWFGVFAVAKVATAFIASDVLAKTIGLILAGYVLGYSAIALRRVFGDSWLKTMVKAAGLVVLYLLCFVPVSLGLLAYAIWKM